MISKSKGLLGFLVDASGFILFGRGGWEIGIPFLVALALGLLGCFLISLL